MKIALSIAATVLVLGFFPAVSPAPVPPQDCGFIKVGGKRFNVKTDQLRCKRGLEYARSYAKGGGKPKGFKCTNYGPETTIEFRCAKGGAVFFAIRR